MVGSQSFTVNFIMQLNVQATVRKKGCGQDVPSHYREEMATASSLGLCHVISSGNMLPSPTNLDRRHHLVEGQES